MTVAGVDDLANFIRSVDGNNTMGAGALAEAILSRYVVAERDASANTPPDTAPTDTAPTGEREVTYSLPVWPETTQEQA